MKLQLGLAGLLLIVATITSNVFANNEASASFSQSSESEASSAKESDPIKTDDVSSTKTEEESNVENGLSNNDIKTSALNSKDSSDEAMDAQD